MKKIWNVLSIIFLLTSISTKGQQTKEELQRKKEQLLQEIAQAQKEIATTKEGKRSIIGDLRVIEKNIDRRMSVINNIKGEVYYVEKDIIHTYRDIDTLKRELNVLKEQYAQSVIYAYKNRSNYDFLNFLFSSENFGDVLRRITYLKTYRGFREKKAGDILHTQQLMQHKVASLTGKRQEKSSALQEQGKQMNALAEEKKQKDVVIAQLSSKEKELKISLQNKEKQRKEVQNAIAAVIRREVAEAKAKAKREAEAEAARRKAKQEAEVKRLAELAAAKVKSSTNTENNTPKSKPVTENVPVANLPKPVEKPARQASALESSPDVVVISQNFEENRHNMPWPVDKGIITLHYGNNQVGKLSIPSDGITFETAIGASVRSIFDGVVSSVFNVGQYKFVTIIHGKYFSTYGNLQSTSVARGQKIVRGQTIGTAGANDSGVGESYLQVDTERGTIDPESWIKNR